MMFVCVINILFIFVEKSIFLCKYPIDEYVLNMKIQI